MGLDSILRIKYNLNRNLSFFLFPWKFARSEPTGALCSDDYLIKRSKTIAITKDICLPQALLFVWPTPKGCLWQK
jgi:hypothetical protein